MTHIKTCTIAQNHYLNIACLYVCLFVSVTIFISCLFVCWCVVMFVCLLVWVFVSIGWFTVKGFNFMGTLFRESQTSVIFAKQNISQIWPRPEIHKHAKCVSS